MGAKLGVIAALAGVPVVIFVVIIGLVVIAGSDSGSGSGGTGGGGGAGIGGGLLPGSVPAGYNAFVTEAGTHCPEISAPLIAAQLEQESGFNPKAISAAGAEGIAQFTPATWRSWGKDYSGDKIADIWNPQDAIGSQADYMCGLVDMMKGWINRGKVSGDVVELALAGYNAGPAWVLQAHGIPPIPETIGYIKSITDLIKKYTAPAEQNPDKRVETAIAAAEAEDHDRYVFGAAGPDAWDCSSLVQHAWRAAGVQLPRTTFEQVKSPVLERVPWQDRRRGDLIYFHIDGGALPDHVGLALNDHIMIHASHPHPNPEDDIVHADYTIRYYTRTNPIVMRVILT